MNLSKSQISFAVKDSDKAVHTDHIECGNNLEYRFAVSIITANTSVELLDFEMQSQ